ncbi:hypothetical protein D3C78_245290 [compost metagenome]
MARVSLCLRGTHAHSLMLLLLIAGSYVALVGSVFFLPLTLLFALGLTFGPVDLGAAAIGCYGSQLPSALFIAFWIVAHGRESPCA